MRRNQNSNNKSKNADKGKDKDQTLDTSDLLIESRLMRIDRILLLRRCYMYGLIVKLTAASGRRAELIEVLGGDDSHTIKGCLSFIVAEDTANEDGLWITEVWESETSHKASLDLPPARPGLPAIETLITRHERIAVTKPVEKHSHPMHGKVPLRG